MRGAAVPGRSDLCGRNWGRARVRYVSIDGLSRPAPGGKWQESDGWIRLGTEPRSKRPPLTARVVRVVAAQKSGAMSAKPTPISQFLSVCMSPIFGRMGRMRPAKARHIQPILCRDSASFRSQHDPEGLEMINDHREADRGTVERLKQHQPIDDQTKPLTSTSGLSCAR